MEKLEQKLIETIDNTLSAIYLLYCLADKKEPKDTEEIEFKLLYLESLRKLYIGSVLKRIDQIEKEKKKEEEKEEEKQ